MYRVCHVFPFFSIRHFGGTSDWMYKLAKAQAKSGMEPTILSGDYLFDWELAKTLPDVRFKVLRSFFDKAGFSLSPALFRFVRNELHAYDLVHMHVFRTFQNIVLYYYCRKYGIPYVVDAHGAVPYYNRKRLLKRIFDRLIGYKILVNASAIIAETKTGVEEYVDILPTISRDRIRIIPPPFDIDEYSNLPKPYLFREKLGISHDHKLIMFLGRVHWIKGNDLLIQGFAELCKKRQDLSLAIVGGDDGHMSECKSLAKLLNVQEKVYFPGFLAAENKLSALVDADVVVQLSRHEQGAWAPIEAVLAGTPILVSRETGSGEDVIRLNAGYTVDPCDPKAVAAALDKIIENYTEAKALTLAAAHDIKKHHSMDARIHEFFDLYNNCKGGSGGGASQRHE